MGAACRSLRYELLIAATADWSKSFPALAGGASAWGIGAVLLVLVLVINCLSGFLADKLAKK